MKKSKLLTITAIIALATVGTTVTVFAQSVSSTKASGVKTQVAQVIPKGQKGQHENRFKTALDALVANNTITADQETAIIKALKPQFHIGTIVHQPMQKVTSTEKVAQGQRVKTALDGLVSAGTITQSQEDAVVTALKQAMPQHQGHGDKAPTQPTTDSVQ